MFVPSGQTEKIHSSMTLLYIFQHLSTVHMKVRTEGFPTRKQRHRHEVCLAGSKCIKHVHGQVKLRPYLSTE